MEPAPRAPRCHLLDALSNRCPNESITLDSPRLCAHHLAEAHRTFTELTRVNPSGPVIPKETS
jgi:hypothetical protein